LSEEVEYKNKSKTGAGVKPVPAFLFTFVFTEPGVCESISNSLDKKGQGEV